MQIKISEKTEALVSRLDTSSSEQEFEVLCKLDALEGVLLCDVFLNRFRATKKGRVRESFLNYSMKYARKSNAAVEMGLIAIQDRARMVRHLGCMLVAISLRDDLISHLRGITLFRDADTKADIIAAISAIESKNHHYFIDRSQSGKIKFNGPWDE